MSYYREDDVKDSLKNHLLRCGAEFKTEVRFEDCIIDFLAKFGGNWVGIEAKGSDNNMLATVGQLANYYKFLSHVYLCAPSLFIKRFEDGCSRAGVFREAIDHIGIMEFDGGVIKTLREASNTEYYLRLPHIQKNEPLGKKGLRNDAALDCIDENILGFLKSRGVATIWEIAQNQGFQITHKAPYESISRRIGNLTSLGYTRILNKYPKTVALVIK